MPKLSLKYLVLGVKNNLGNNMRIIMHKTRISNLQLLCHSSKGATSPCSLKIIPKHFGHFNFFAHKFSKICINTSISIQKIIQRGNIGKFKTNFEFFNPFRLFSYCRQP